MDRRAMRAGLAIGSVLMTACKAASGPQPAKPSNASVTDMFGKSHAASGPAYMRHSNKSGNDLVYVFESRTNPSPDCSMVRTLESDMPDLDEGGWVGLAFKERLKVGKNAVSDAAFISGVKNQSLSVGTGETDGLVLEIRKADGQTLEATLNTDPTAKHPASGAIFAVVCTN